MTEQLCAIFIRSPVGIRKDIKDTLRMLSLTKKNACIVVPDTPQYRGMIEKVKDFIAYGTISPEAYAELQQKRGDKKHPSLFFLHPPRGGYERKGIKFAYAQGGALGNRHEKINDLIKRML
jgi:large subunit ribosomal protein L30